MSRETILKSIDAAIQPKKRKPGMSLSSFCEEATETLGGILGESVVSARLKESPYNEMARFMALGSLCLDALAGRHGVVARYATPRIVALQTPPATATLPAAATAPTAHAIDDRALLALGKKVFGPGFVREGASRGDVEVKFKMEQIRLPGVSGPTRELFGLEKMTQVSRQEIVDAFLKTGKL